MLILLEPALAIAILALAIPGVAQRLCLHGNRGHGRSPFALSLWSKMLDEPWCVCPLLFEPRARLSRFFEPWCVCPLLFEPRARLEA